MRTRHTMVGLAALLLLQPPAVADAPESTTLVLKASSAWNLDYNDDSCRLARQFGEGSQRMLVMFEQFSPRDRFLLAIAGKPLGAREARSTDVEFGPNGAAREKVTFNASMGEFGPAVIVGSMKLYGPSADENDGTSKEARRRFELEKLPLFAAKLDPTKTKSIAWLDVRPAHERPVRLEIGPMDAPMNALRKCTEELVGHWGLDSAQLATMAQPPIPRNNPGMWLGPGDYPADALRKDLQGMVVFRLMVDKKGKPVSCHVQRSTGVPSFDKATCESLMGAARFEPALDAAGQPMDAFWQSSAIFRMPC